MTKHNKIWYLDRTREMIGVPPNGKQLFLAETQRKLLKIHNPGFFFSGYDKRMSLGMPGWTPQGTVSPHPVLINAKNIHKRTLKWYNEKQEKAFIKRIKGVVPDFDFGSAKIQGVIEFKEGTQIILGTK